MGDFWGNHRFEVRRRLGEGSLGVVYEAFDKVHIQRVALKVLRRTDAQSLYRVKTQFPVLSRCTHPNLVPFGELFEEDGLWFFTMAMVSGFDLVTFVCGGLRPAAMQKPHSIIDTDTVPVDVEPVSAGAAADIHACDERLLRPILTQAALALLSLHRASIVHRNVKPPNLLVSPEGRVSVLDYGLVPAESGGALQPESRDLRTAAYLAPERAFAHTALPESDWYSLGVVLYEALTGTLPHTGETQLDLLMSKQEHRPQSPRAVRPAISQDLDELCMDLLSNDPRERPNGYEVLDRLGVDFDSIASTGHRVAVSAIAASSRTFVGREKELESMRRAFERTLRGGSPSVTIIGESGMGKTALIRRFIELVTAEFPGAVVLTGRWYEGSVSPFEAFDDVLEALAEHLRSLSDDELSILVPGNAQLLTRMFPELARVEALAQAEPPSRLTRDPHELRARAFSALRALLARIGESQPLVVVLDSMQWADPDSLALLDELTREPDPPSMLLVMGSRAEVRPDEVGADGPPATEEATDGAAHTVLRLGPLDRRAAPELARVLLKRAHATGIDPFVIALEARGHPLFIDELVRHAVHLGRADRASLRLDDAIGARVFGLPPLARYVLELVCTAGVPLGRDQLADAAKLGSTELTGHIDLLARTNLVRRRGWRDDVLVEPYHDRIAEAVISHLEPDTLAERHARLAIALEGSGAEVTRPDLLICHLEAAGERAKAARLALRAAAAATDSLAFERAVALYQTALRLGDFGGEEATNLRCALGDALAAAGQGLRAANTLLEAAADADPATRLDCRRKAAEQLLVSGHVERGIETLASVLTAYGVKYPRTPRRALASILWRRALLRVRGLRWKPRHPSELRTRDLARLDVFRSVARGIGMVDNIRGTDFQVRGLRLALATGEKTRVGLFIAQEAIYLGSQGMRRVPRARKLLLKARIIAQEVADPAVAGWVAGGEGILAYFEGRFDTAARLCAEAEAIFRSMPAGAWWESSSVALFRLYSLVRMGVYRKLERARARLLREAARRNDRYAETTVKRYSSSVWLAKAQPEDALRELDDTDWPLPHAGFHLQHWYELQARGELALYQRKAASQAQALRDGFAEMNRSLLTRIEVVRTLAEWLRGRLALARCSDTADSRGDLVEARKMQRALARAPLPCHAAWAAFLGAGIAWQSGDQEAAIQHLLSAEELSATHDMPFCASVATRRRGEIVGGDEGVALTAAADEAMRDDGIEDPERMCEIVAPGFEPRG